MNLNNSFLEANSEFRNYSLIFKITGYRKGEKEECICISYLRLEDRSQPQFVL